MQFNVGTATAGGPPRPGTCQVCWHWRGSHVGPLDRAGSDWACEATKTASALPLFACCLSRLFALSSLWRLRPELQPQCHLTWRYAIGKCGGSSGAGWRRGAEAARRLEVMSFRGGLGLQILFPCAQWRLSWGGAAHTWSPAWREAELRTKLTSNAPHISPLSGPGGTNESLERLEGLDFILQSFLLREPGRADVELSRNNTTKRSTPWRNHHMAKMPLTHSLKGWNPCRSRSSSGD